MCIAYLVVVFDDFVVLGNPEKSVESVSEYSTVTPEVLLTTRRLHHNTSPTEQNNTTVVRYRLARETTLCGV